MNISDIHIIVSTKVMQFLSWKRIIIFFFSMLAICLVVFSVQPKDFSAHKRIPLDSDKIKLLSVSDTLQDRIKLATKSDLIIGVRVLTLNFQRNIRIQTYVYIDNKDLQKLYEDSLSHRVYDVPIFNSDAADNNRILHIVNGEFICVPFKESLSYTLVPQAAQFVDSICAIGIPPYNNDVSGMISVYLRRVPTPEEREQLFIFMRDTSLQIYNDSQKK